MKKDFFTEIEISLSNKDMVKLGAVFNSASSLSEKDMALALDKVCGSSFFSIAKPLLSLMERCDLTSGFITEKIPQLTAITRDEPEVVLSLLQAGKYRYLQLPILLAGELELEHGVSCLHELLKLVTLEEDQQAIFSTLGKIGVDESVSRLKVFLDMSRLPLTMKALEAIARIGSKESLEVILDVLGRDKELDLFCIGLLPSMQYVEGIQKLSEFIKSSDVDIRNYAIDGLISTGALAIPFLHDLLEEKERDVLIMATNALGFIKRKESVKPLIKLTKKEDPNIRYAAFEALGRMNSKLAILHLPPGILDEEEQVRVAAMTALEVNIENEFTLRGMEKFFCMRQENIEAVAYAAVVAGAKKVFLALSEDELFRELFYNNYYKVKTGEDQKAFMEFLKQEKREDLLQDFMKWGKVRNDQYSLTVLVVDDSKIMHKIIESALVPLNHRTVSAFDGREGLKRLEEESIDIVLTDMNMPVMNGMEFVKSIRKEKKMLSLPIVMITTQSGVPDKEQALSAGVNYFLTKPFKNDKLMDIFRDYFFCGRKRAS